MSTFPRNETVRTDFPYKGLAYQGLRKVQLIDPSYMVGVSVSYTTSFITGSKWIYMVLADMKQTNDIATTRYLTETRRHNVWIQRGIRNP